VSWDFTTPRFSKEFHGYALLSEACVLLRQCGNLRTSVYFCVRIVVPAWDLQMLYAAILNGLVDAPDR
jgi:hypothetical protein